MFVQYNPNPYGAKVGDCVIRAISKALDTSWDSAYVEMALEGFILGDMPSSDRVWGSLLMSKGFTRHVIKDECPNCYTTKMFCNDHPKGVYVLAYGGHVATVKDGDLYDTWDSSDEVPIYFYNIKEE